MLVKNVVIICDSLGGQGGASQVALCTARSLLARGVKVFFFVRRIC